MPEHRVARLGRHLGGRRHKGATGAEPRPSAYARPKLQVAVRAVLDQVAGRQRHRGSPGRKQGPRHQEVAPAAPTDVHAHIG
eukprot:3828499-Pyramimonas_sp.AAC.1